MSKSTFRFANCGFLLAGALAAVVGWAIWCPCESLGNDSESKEDVQTKAAIKAGDTFKPTDLLLRFSDDFKKELNVDDLTLEMGEYSNDNSANNNLDLSLKDARTEFEKEYLLSQIKRFNGNISKVSEFTGCLLYTSPSPRDGLLSRMPSSA